MYRDPDTDTYGNNAPYGSNVPHMENVPHVHHGHHGYCSMPVYGYGHFADVCGYDGYGCHGYSSFFALIVVLFILLIIIGTCTFGNHSCSVC